MELCASAPFAKNTNHAHVYRTHIQAPPISNSSNFRCAFWPYGPHVDPDGGRPTGGGRADRRRRTARGWQAAGGNTGTYIGKSKWAQRTLNFRTTFLPNIDPHPLTILPGHSPRAAHPMKTRPLKLDGS